MPLIKEKIFELHRQHRYRRRCVIGQELINFAENDYLGLRHHPQVVAACIEASKKYGVGSGASALISGYSYEHQQLEQELADFLGYEKTLLFSSGYLANLAVLSSICQRGEVIYSDKLNHASLIDGARLSRAEVIRYPHVDVVRLAELLAKEACSKPKQGYILSDGVFSMDGDIAPYEQLRELADQYAATLIIDDAHGVGIMGPAGRGSWNDFGPVADILIGTLGKAFGTQGAYVAGTKQQIDWLVQTGRTYIYTTALAPPIVAASRASLEILRSGDNLRAALAANIQYFRAGAQQLGLQLLPSDTAIQPLILGSEKRLLRWADSLRQAGILVGAIRPPTVAEGSSRLRITISAVHSAEQINQLLEALNQCQQQD